MIYTIVIFNDDGQIEDTIAFDSVSSFDEGYRSSVPQSAVEDGYNVADTMIKENDKFSLSGVITSSFFRRKGAMVVYIGGRFVRPYADVDPLPTDNVLITMKQKLKDIRDKGIIFGIFESQTPSTEGSQVNLIYPCALSDLSFSNRDGGNAIYPNMSFEKIRVTKVEFQKVENPTPELVPYVRHANGGNQTGNSGSIQVKGVGGDDDGVNIKSVKEEAKEFVPDSLKKEDSWADKKVAEQQKQKDALLAANAAKESVLKNVSAGVIGYRGSGAIVDNAQDVVMKQKYGEDWNK